MQKIWLISWFTKSLMVQILCYILFALAKLVMGQAISGVASGVSVVFSLWNLSTPTGLWMTMNQFQLILLLLLTKSNIPKSIVDYLAGLKATTWSFNFIPFKNIPGINKMIDYFDYKSSKKELDYFGIFSGSSVANNFALMCILVIVAAIHSAFLLINRLLKRKVSSMLKWLKCLLLNFTPPPPGDDRFPKVFLKYFSK